MSEPAFTYISLATGVELLTGPDNIPQLHMNGRKIHVRLGTTAVEILRFLQERRHTLLEDLQSHLKSRYQLRDNRVRRLLQSFLTGLEQLGVLAQNCPSSAVGPNIAGTGRSLSLK